MAEEHVCSVYVCWACFWINRLCCVSGTALTCGGQPHHQLLRQASGRRCGLHAALPVEHTPQSNTGGLHQLTRVNEPTLIQNNKHEAHDNIHEPYVPSQKRIARVFLLPCENMDQKLHGHSYTRVKNTFSLVLVLSNELGCFNLFKVNKLKIDLKWKWIIWKRNVYIFSYYSLSLHF